ncbi:pentapeptide repeat-containing protein [Nocardia kruczakiae]|uniref:pentapeptide repeat-containing protein n=1 Tax=Nocardia kruczakiae TaxID=261477 RepID=UPI0012EE0AA5|nr:pentapeptide repeat-containing protein [Nocardia kruczakiae]
MTRRVSALRAQAHTRPTALRAALTKESRAAFSRRAGRIQLFPAVTAALLAGLAVAFAAYGFLRWITPVDTTKQAAEIDITRVALTVVAGVGGVVALVIAYRRQRDLEQSRFVERFGAAAAQLGATDVAVRIAGVYAMAGVADASDGPRRQQCIDVLCGYLRLPYNPELGANHQSKLVVKQHRATADNTHADDREHHHEYRHNDREVRATIVRVITDHLRPEAAYSWSTADFDFRTAYLENVDFGRAQFSGAARFGGATFSGDAWLGSATFAGNAEFDGAIFSGNAWFDDVTFSGNAHFDGATFSGNAWFDGATLSGNSRFDKATFAENASFAGANFSADARFGGATFAGDAHFGGTTFTGHARFDGVTFSGNARFDGATFSGNARFGNATFARDARFNGATLSGNARFGDASFAGDAGFCGTTFAGNTGFDSVTFSGDAEFGEASFSCNAEFGDVTFARNAGFDGTTFSGDTGFGGTAFAGNTRFDGATFAGNTWFGSATFAGKARFDRVTFAANARFDEADFGSDTISFDEPRQWGPPAPVFDWSQDNSRKPTNIEPQDWPPVAAARNH